MLSGGFDDVKNSELMVKFLELNNLDLKEESGPKPANDSSVQEIAQADAGKLANLKNFVKQRTQDEEFLNKQDPKVRRSSVLSIPSASDLLDQIEAKRANDADRTLNMSNLPAQVDEEDDLSMENLMGSYLADQHEQKAKE